MPAPQSYAIYIEITAAGTATCRIVKVDEALDYVEVANEEFGPFDTTLDVCTWVVRRLVRDGAHLAR